MLWIGIFYLRIYFTTLYITVDHEVDVIELTEEAEPENSVSKAEGYNNIAGWLCFTAPKLSKLGKRKSAPDQTLESEFVVSDWIDLQSQGNQKGLVKGLYPKGQLVSKSRLASRRFSKKTNGRI